MVREEPARPANPARYAFSDVVITLSDLIVYVSFLLFGTYFNAFL